MPAGVMEYKNWRIKPSSRLPIFLRFVINESFTKEVAHAAGFENNMPNRVFVKFMMYWNKTEYDAFEKEITEMAQNGKKLSKFLKQEFDRANELRQLGDKLAGTNWKTKTNQELIDELNKIINVYHYLIGPWYTQHPLDEYFENQIFHHLEKIIPRTKPKFKKYLQIFTDAEDKTEVAKERYQILLLAKEIKDKKLNIDNLPAEIDQKINEHVKKFGYINRGLATGKAYTKQDIISRIWELQSQNIDDLAEHSSKEKLVAEFEMAMTDVKPNSEFKKIIDFARFHSFLRNRRVENFFYADYQASFFYSEIAKRTKFNPEWIMEISPQEMINGLNGKPMPNDSEMRRRLANYAMIVQNCVTTLISDPVEIEKLAQEYKISTKQKTELKGMVASPGYGKGRAKVFMDVAEISRMEKGDVLVAQFTTPDFVPAMEKATAIVTDQGGVSSHAAIVSRELKVPCVIATKEATRVIKEGDLVEVDAQTGIVTILEKQV